MPEVTEHVHHASCFIMPAVSFEEEYDGMSVGLDVDEGLFSVVSVPLAMKIGEPSETVRNSVESRLNGIFDYRLMEISVTSGENEVIPSDNITLTFRNPGTPIRMKEAIVCQIDSSGKETRLAVSKADDDSLQIQTRTLGTFVIASPALTEPSQQKAAVRSSTRDAASYAARLTDRSNDIGVFSEGYDDSPYTYEKTYRSPSNLWVPDMDNSVGGTVYVGRSSLLGTKRVYQAEQYWDGKVPFRITSEVYEDGSNADAQVDFQNYNDFLLEDGSRLSGVTAPDAPIKFDNINLLYCRVNIASQVQNLYGRGNKFVIGENVTAESGKTWKLYGGTEHSSSAITGEGRPLYINEDINIDISGGHVDHIVGTSDTSELSG